MTPRSPKRSKNSTGRVESAPYCLEIMPAENPLRFEPGLARGLTFAGYDEEGWVRRPVGSVAGLEVKVIPGASADEVAGTMGTAVKIKLRAPPVEGRANEALLRFVAECFRVPQRNVAIRQGGQSRHKRVEVRGSAVEPESLLGG